MCRCTPTHRKQGKCVVAKMTELFSIIFEPFINLGFVRVGKEKQEQIFFKNEGKTSGKVELKYENLNDFKIEPTSFTIQQGQEYAVNLIYKYLPLLK